MVFMRRDRRRKEQIGLKLRVEDGGGIPNERGNFLLLKNSKTLNPVKYTGLRLYGQRFCLPNLTI